MIIFRYLSKEISRALIAITSVLLLIFLSNQFVRYLARAAAGQLPAHFVLQLMLLEVPHLLGLLLPLSFFLAILLAYGRLYADSEMTIFTASGISQTKLLWMTLQIACLVAILVAGLTLWLGPTISADRDRLIQIGKSASVINTLIPGRFRSLSGGKRVLYVQRVMHDRQEVGHLFMAQATTLAKDHPTWTVLAAKSGHVDTKKDGSQFFIATQGQRYIGIPGQQDYRVQQFEQFGVRLTHAALPVKQRIKSMTTKALWSLRHQGLKYAAELQWRFSIPVMVFVLALLAVPLSVVNPRQGKYAKILPSVLLLIIYANLMFVGREWLATGKVPMIVGMWWLHGLFTALALGLFLLPFAKRCWQRYWQH